MLCSELLYLSFNFHPCSFIHPISTSHLLGRVWVDSPVDALVAHSDNQTHLASLPSLQCDALQVNMVHTWQEMLEIPEMVTSCATVSNQFVLPHLNLSHIFIWLRMIFSYLLANKHVSCSSTRLKLGFKHLMESFCLDLIVDECNESYPYLDVFHHMEHMLHIMCVFPHEYR